jgi:hypothetical protein
MIAEVLDGYWSVDFACDTAGKWHMIDMARGEISWHPPNCEHYKDYFAAVSATKTADLDIEELSENDDAGY